MAMVFCRGCGREIHDSAPACPHCGAPQFLKTNLNSAFSNSTDEGFLENAIRPIKRYAEFSGRSRRKEYWFFFLGYFLVVFGLGFLSAVVGSAGQVLLGIFYLAIIIPSLAVGVRRMHDTDRSGWWLIAPIANMVFVCLEGQRGSNRFGPDPKG